MKTYFLHNYKDIPQIKKLSREQRFDIKTVGTVLPFKVNSFVIDELIDWSDIPGDPIFNLTFPQKAMLRQEHYDIISSLLRQKVSQDILAKEVKKIRKQLNPNPAGQLDYNVPKHKNRKLYGIQHKYRETVLFFPSEGQTCHTYCSFCFRWPQFIGIKNLRFASREAESLQEYLTAHPEVTDILFTGGDPFTMKASVFDCYIESLLHVRSNNISNIRIGTKAPIYNPYRFLTDPDADDLIRSLEKIVKAGKHLAIMLHINHYREMQTDAFRRATQRLQDVGAVIRTQSPFLKGINDTPEVWVKMWSKQVNLGFIPYYAFITRDTGAQHYFGIPLVKAWDIFQKAYQQVGGLCRTVRGPSMSAIPGKVQVLGLPEINGKKVFALRMLQGRNPDWVHRPFFAEYDENATWLSDLKPAFGEDKFFFEDELEQIFKEKYSDSAPYSYE